MSERLTSQQLTERAQRIIDHRCIASVEYYEKYNAEAGQGLPFNECGTLRALLSRIEELERDKERLTGLLQNATELKAYLEDRSEHDGWMERPRGSHAGLGYVRNDRAWAMYDLACGVIEAIDSATRTTEREG